MRDITRRKAMRKAYCRGCDRVIQVGEEMVTTYSFRCQGQHIHFCLECASKIGTLAQQGVE